jgi:hypothetical protein
LFDSLLTTINIIINIYFRFFFKFILNLKFNIYMHKKIIHLYK